MSSVERKKRSAKKSISFWHTISNFAIISMFLGGLAFLAELLLNFLPAGWIFPAGLTVLAFISLIVAVGRIDNAVERFIDISVKSAQASAQEGLSEAESGQLDRALDSCQGAVEELSATEQYIDKAVGEQAQSTLEEEVNDAEENIETIRNKVRYLEKVNEISIRVEVLELQVTDAITLLESKNFGVLTDTLEEIDSEIQEIRSELEPFSQVNHTDLNTQIQDPRRRIGESLEELSAALLSEVRATNELTQQAKERCQPGEYSHAIELFNEAEHMIKNLYEIYGRMEFPDGEFRNALRTDPQPLQTLPAVGEYRADQLTRAGFDNVEDVRDASKRDLNKVEDVGPKTAAEIMRYLDNSSLSDTVEDRLDTIRTERQRAVNQYISKECKALESDLEAVEAHISSGELQTARESISTVDTEFQALVEEVEELPVPEPPSPIREVDQQIESLENQVRQARGGKETLDLADDKLTAAREYIEQGSTDQARTTLEYVQETCENLFEKECLYPSSDQIERRLNDANELLTELHLESLRAEIDEITDKCRRLVGNEDETSIQEAARLADEARSKLSDQVPVGTSVYEELEVQLSEIEDQIQRAMEAEKTQDQDSQPGQSLTESRKPTPAKSSPAFADLTGFQRDALIIISGHDGVIGLEVKEKLESYYEEEVNHGRLYPNLDELVEKGYISKLPQDERSNQYEITERGRKLLGERLSWERSRAPAKESDQSEDSIDSTESTEADVGEDRDQRSEQEDQIEDRTVDESSSVIESLKSEFDEI